MPSESLCYQRIHDQVTMPLLVGMMFLCRLLLCTAYWLHFTWQLLRDRRAGVVDPVPGSLRLMCQACMLLITYGTVQWVLGNSTYLQLPELSAIRDCSAV